MKTPAPTRFERRRFWLAAWTAPMIGPALVFFGETFVSDFPHHLLDLGRAGKFIGAFWAFLIVSYAVTLGTGLPTLAFLTRRGLDNGAFVTGAATLWGAMWGWAFALLARMNGPPRSFFPWALLGVGAVVAALHGAAFSIVAGLPLADGPENVPTRIENWPEAPLELRIFLGSVFAATVILLAAMVTASFLIPSAE